MHLFFAAVAAGGAPLTERERVWFTDVVRREACIAKHVRRTERIDPTRWSVIVMLSNEPSGGLVESDDRAVVYCGYASDEDSLRSLDASLELADRASRLGGRFAPLVVDRTTERFAMATQVAAVDSIFFASTDRFHFWGNQASVLSVLRDGAVTYDPARLLTLLHAGFFGDAATPYRGVDALPPFTTVLVDGQRAEQRQVPLASLKARSFGARMRRLGSRLLPRVDEVPTKELASSFTGAFSLLRSRPDVRIGLTGGMDSRLILAGALAAHVPVECFTIQKHGPDHPDLYLAKELAALVGVRHRVIEREAERSGPPSTPRELLGVATRTLAATDGMLGIQYPSTTSYAHTGEVSLSGHGGEILRGGYGEKQHPATRDRVRRFFDSMWCHTPQLLREELVRHHGEQADAWLQAYPARLHGGDILDCLYVDRRCGRWVAATTRGSTRRFTPLLDNRLVREVIAAPIDLKRRHALHRALIRTLLPRAAELPLANKFWHGTSKREQRTIRAQWPSAFAAAGGEVARRVITAPRADTIRRYVFDEDRIAVLADLLHVDRVRTYFAEAPATTRSHDRLLAGLYTACVLLTENWRRTR